MGAELRAASPFSFLLDELELCKKQDPGHKRLSLFLIYNQLLISGSEN